ncbi:MAG: glycosyltransferase family 39 protein [Paludibacteraceae bacterium]|nr:glycosyltransferase family 39 protein [Paludibacteraceae bacterium]MBP6284506.1 glycosyltransferase family 39 protein [Paludibacteraceae bacterium]
MKKSVQLLTGLVLLNLFIRALIAYFLEFGNDEVYYVKYVEYPDWSHFDHPIMVQLMGQFTSLNNLLYHEFFYRLGAVLIGSFNTLLVYFIARELYHEKAAFWAAILYNTGIYTALIVGVFFMPDAPLLLFWLIALYYGIRFVNEDKNIYLIAFSIAVLFAVMSKYQAVFLWFGMMLYILVYRRKLLFSPVLYIAIFVSILGLLPTLYWNIDHQFANFKFHTERVGSTKLFAYFPRELFGQLIYNNPILVVVSFVFLFKLIKARKIEQTQAFILFTSLPLIVVSILLSIGTESLPHWSGPSYVGLLILSSVLYANSTHLAIWGKIAIVSIYVLFVFAYVEIQNGFLMNNIVQKQEWQIKGKNDFTQDTYGWLQLGAKIQPILAKYPETQLIVSHNWFPASHLDFYVAKPNSLEVMVVGPAKALHEYYYIQQKTNVRGSHNSAFFIESSNHRSAIEQLSAYLPLQSQELIDSVMITRRNDTIRVEKIYRVSW